MHTERILEEKKLTQNNLTYQYKAFYNHILVRQTHHFNMALNELTVYISSVWEALGFTD